MTGPADAPHGKSYRDYFIVGGRHVGDYEGMYRDCPDPWRIEELGLRLDMRAALTLLEAFPPEPPSPGAPLRVLDAGAGAGLFSLALYRALAAAGLKADLTLADISPTALAMARERFAREGVDPPRTAAFDLRLLAGRPQGGGDPLNVPFPAGSFDLIVLAQSLWGIVGEIAGVASAFHRMLTPSGLLLVSQHFPGRDRQEWGREVAGPEDLSRILRAASFSLAGELETDRFSNHHWGALWRST